MKFLDEEFLLREKERLLREYDCQNIKEVIKTLEFRLSEKKSPLGSPKYT
ncbi:MAG: hypothetical protein ABIH34_02525 [Nanoarchaeota archaeon]